MMGQCRYGRYGRYGRQHPTAEVFRELPADMIFLGSGLEFVPKRKGAGREAVRTFTDPDPMQEKKYHKTSNWIKCLWNGIVLRELYVAKPRPLDWVGWQAFGWISASKYLPNVHIESSTCSEILRLPPDHAHKYSGVTGHTSKGYCNLALNDQLSLSNFW